MVTHVNGVNAPVAPHQAPKPAAAAAPRPDFRTLLQGALRPDAEVRLSAHARERLRERNIVLNDRDLERISNAADKVASKGGRDALVVMDQIGLILDVHSRTVVTAVDRSKLQDNVFTNIDSAVFA